MYEIGRWHYNQLTDEDLKECVKCMNRIIQIDPNFVPAYVTLSEVAEWLASDVTAEERSRMRRDAARKLLALAPNLGETHVAVAMVKYEEEDEGGADAELREAVRLSPNYANAHAYLGYDLANHGLADEALVELEFAQKLERFLPKAVAAAP